VFYSHFLRTLPRTFTFYVCVTFTFTHVVVVPRFRLPRLLLILLHVDYVCSLPFALRYVDLHAFVVALLLRCYV